VEISSLGQTWAIEGSFRGTCEIGPDALWVKLSDSYLVAPAATGGERYVAGIRLGLATERDGKGWTVGRWSNGYAIGKALQPGEKHELPAIELEIRAPPMTDIEKHWLVVQIAMSRRGLPGRLENWVPCCYAHGSRRVFVGCGRSPEQAARNREQEHQ